MIVPVYARAGADPRLAAGGVRGSRRAQLAHGAQRACSRSRCPGVVAGSIFTFSLTLGDFITPLLVGGASSNFIGNVIYANIGTANNLPFAAALAMVPDRDHGLLPARRAGARRVRGDVMEGRAGTASACGSGSAACCCSCSCRSRSSASTRSTARTCRAGRSTGLSAKWFSVAWHDQQVRAALVLSVKAGLFATVDRAAARLGGRVRRAPVPVLRPRGGVAAAGPAAGAARHHHRDRAATRPSASPGSTCRC